jgi:hypothetical protein
LNWLLIRWQTDLTSLRLSFSEKVSSKYSVTRPTPSVALMT